MVDASAVITEHRFLAFDETPIFYRRVVRDPAGICASVLVVHGMGEHGGRYQAMAQALSTQGMAIYLPDLRGFGKSGGKRGCVRHFQDYLEDLKVIRRLAHELSCGQPFFILGHSFGGLIASSYVAQTSGIGISGLILSSPNFGIAIPIPGIQRILAKTASVLFPDLTLSNRVDTHFLSHETSLMAEYDKDPLIYHRLSLRLYAELDSMMAQRAVLAKQIPIPVLGFQAGDDHVVSKEDTVRFFELLQSKDKTLHILPGAYHEVLNEIGRFDTYQKIGSWVLQRA